MCQVDQSDELPKLLRESIPLKKPRMPRQDIPLTDIFNELIPFVPTNFEPDNKVNIPVITIEPFVEEAPKIKFKTEIDDKKLEEPYIVKPQKKVVKVKKRKIQKKQVQSIEERQQHLLIKTIMKTVKNSNWDEPDQIGNQTKSPGLPPVDLLLAHIERVKQVNEQIKEEHASNSTNNNPKELPSKRNLNSFRQISVIGSNSQSTISKISMAKSMTTSLPQINVENIDSSSLLQNFGGEKSLNQWNYQKKRALINFEQENKSVIDFELSQHECKATLEYPENCNVCGKQILFIEESKSQIFKQTNNPGSVISSISVSRLLSHETQHNALDSQKDTYSNNSSSKQLDISLLANQIMEQALTVDKAYVTPDFTAQNSNKHSDNVSRNINQDTFRDFKSTESVEDKTYKPDTFSNQNVKVFDLNGNNSYSRDSKVNVMKISQNESSKSFYENSQKKFKGPGSENDMSAKIDQRKDIDSNYQDPETDKLHKSQIDGQQLSLPRSWGKILVQTEQSGEYIEEEYEQEMEEQISDKQISQSLNSSIKKLSDIRKQEIRKSAQEIIPPEYKHLFCKEEQRSSFNSSKSKKHMQKAKIYKLGIPEELRLSNNQDSLEEKSEASQIQGRRTERIQLSTSDQLEIQSQKEKQQKRLSFKSLFVVNPSQFATKT